MLRLEYVDWLKRKLRRLDEAANATYRVIDNGGEIRNEMDNFLSLFAMNREDKALFMNEQMALFFLSLAESLAEFTVYLAAFTVSQSLPNWKAFSSSLPATALSIPIE